MRKRVKKIVTILTAAAFAVLAAFPALAGQWRQDDNGWWWQNDDGSYPANQWAWIDGNHDGIAECYYLGPDGYMAANAAIQGMAVDANGCMTEFGVVQTTELFGRDYDKAFEMVADLADVQIIDYRDHTQAAETIEEEYEEIDPYELAYRIVDLVNEERASKGKGELIVNDELMGNAEVRAEEASNAEQGKGHIRPDGSKFATVITVDHSSSSENLAWTGGRTMEQLAEYAVSAWIDSPGHHVNMLQSKWEETGVGIFIEESATGPIICAAQLFIEK